MNQEHCENCGSTDYEDLHTGDQGYTACCNELACNGGTASSWTAGILHRNTSRTVLGSVRACCPGVADQEAKKLDPDAISLYRN